jgi:hypothetical protein
VVETEDFLPEITFQYGVGKGLPEARPSEPAISASSRRWASRRWSSRRWSSRWSSRRWSPRWRGVLPRRVGVSIEGHLGTAW